MPDQHSKLASSKLSLRDRFGEWAGSSPIVGVPVIVATIGYGLLRLPDRMARGYLTMKFTSLEKFEPSHEGFGRDPLTPPYWQDLVFGDDRANRLIKKLEGIPQVKPSVQKLVLQRSKGGLAVLPAHRELIKYGLTDVLMYYFMRKLDSKISNFTSHKDFDAERGRIISFDDDVALKMDQHGVYTTDDSKMPIIEQGNENQYISMSLTDLIDTYRATGYGDEKAVAVANKISQAVYNWVLEDVLTVVPNFFVGTYDRGYKATLQADGSFLLDRHPQDYQLKDHAKGATGFTERNSAQNTKTSYEILVDGYKGTLPLRPTQLAQEQPGFTPG